MRKEGKECWWVSKAYKDDVHHHVSVFNKPCAGVTMW